MIQTKRTAPNAGTLEAIGNESSDRVDSSSTIHHYRVARLARGGERWRPAAMSDVIVERGEYVGDCHCHTLDGQAYEPLSWGALIRI